MEELSSPDENTRTQAARDLRQHPAPEVVDALEHALRRAAPGPFWSALVESLAACGDARAVPCLLEQLSQQRRDLYRLPLLRALGQLGGEAATRALLRVLDEPEGSAWRVAAEGLARTAPREAIDAILDVFARAQDARPWVEALRALQRAHPGEGVGDRLLLRVFWGESQEGARVAACSLLAEFPSEGGRALLEELQKTASPRVRRAAREALRMVSPC
jgi:HEAT repeat protein